MASTGGRADMIALLQQVQEREGYVSPQAAERIARAAGASVAEVYGVASFFNQFRFNEPGRHSVKVCTGTACHVKGASLVADEFERQLGVGDGETTPDGEFDLERVACVGCCTLAPVVVVDGQAEGPVDTAGVKKVLRRIRLADEEAAGAPRAGETT